MKYQVYTALIATTTAGPYADKINDLMPTEAETTQMEAKTEKWINDTQTIVDEATPSVEARNERIDRAFRAHGQQYREIKRNGTMSIQRTKREWGTEVSDAQREFETTVQQEGLVAEWDQLVGEVQQEMNGMNMAVKRLRLSTKALKNKKVRSATNLSVRSDFHEAAPTPAEVEEAETIITEWFERGEKIMDDAQPGIEARDDRMVRAFERAEQEENEINERMIDDLIDAQVEFEEEIIEAEHHFEEELTQNGVVADWQALEDKIQRDMQAMKKFNTRVVSLKRRHAVVQRAQVKLNMNLARVSEEMSRNSPNPAELDALKVKVIDWTTRYESIAERVEPIEETRNNKWAESTEDGLNEYGETVEKMFADWEQNDRQFMQEVEDAEDDMLETWEQQGTIDKIERLGDDIDASLEAAANSMNKVQSNISLRKKIFTQSLSRIEGCMDMAGLDAYGDSCTWYDSNPSGCGRYDHDLFYAAVECCACGGGIYNQVEIEAPDMDMEDYHLHEELDENYPGGQKIKEVFDTVTSWVGDYENIWEKAEPATVRRNRNVHDATEDRLEEVDRTLEDAFEAHENKERRFWNEIENAQEDFEDRMENEGIVERERQLERDIDNQLNQWGNGMKRVGQATSLAAKKSDRATMNSLKSLQAEIDDVLSTL